jgi:hypothetical protein
MMEFSGMLNIMPSNFHTTPNYFKKWHEVRGANEKQN